MKRTPAAKSVTRCRPIQMVLTPGSPSPLRARKPPSMATRRTMSFRLGGSFGMGLFVNTCAARISSGSNINEAGNSGQVRPSRISRAMRQDTTMNSVSARSIFSRLASCSASTRQPFFKTWNSISISQRARYQSMSSMIWADVVTSRLVSSRQHTGLTPAGASISLATRQVISTAPSACLS